MTRPYDIEDTKNADDIIIGRHGGRYRDVPTAWQMAMIKGGSVWSRRLEDAVGDEADDYALLRNIAALQLKEDFDENRFSPALLDKYDAQRFRDELEDCEMHDGAPFYNLFAIVSGCLGKFLDISADEFDDLVERAAQCRVKVEYMVLNSHDFEDRFDGLSVELTKLAAVYDTIAQ